MGERLPYAKPRTDPSVDSAQSRWARRISLGSRILNARLAAGLSQAELAAGLVSVASLSRFEAGERRPSATLLAQLARRMNADPALLSQGEPATARGLRFELAHADLLVALGEFEDAVGVAVDLARIAAQLGADEVAEAARIVRASALASSGDRRKALRALRHRGVGPVPLAALVAEAGVRLAASDFDRTIEIGEQVVQRLAEQESLSHPELATLAVTCCRAHVAVGRRDAARQLARLAIRHLPAADSGAPDEPEGTLFFSYRSFDQAVREIEGALSTLEARRLHECLHELVQVASGVLAERN